MAFLQQAASRGKVACKLVAELVRCDRGDEGGKCVKGSRNWRVWAFDRDVTVDGNVGRKAGVCRPASSNYSLMICKAPRANSRLQTHTLDEFGWKRAPRPLRFP